MCEVSGMIAKKSGRRFPRIFEAAQKERAGIGGDTPPDLVQCGHEFSDAPLKRKNSIGGKAAGVRRASDTWGGQASYSSRRSCSAPNDAWGKTKKGIQVAQTASTSLMKKGRRLDN